MCCVYVNVEVCPPAPRKEKSSERAAVEQQTIRDNATQFPCAIDSTVREWEKISIVIAETTTL